MLFNITFETITPESAEDGDAAESGFHMEEITLREAWEALRWEGYCEASDRNISSARWLTFYGEQDHTTGDITNYSLHFPAKLSQHSRVRIARLFRCYGVK
jgi:hypothetical protein